MAIIVPGATVEEAVIDDPLLGPAHVITTPHGTTTMQAVDWTRPTRIPAIANPAILAGGAGGRLLNEIARRAEAAGVPALRYAGPYPTPALFRSLTRSFTTTASEAEFTADLLGRMARLARDPLPVKFHPAPVTFLEHARGHVELRERPVRAVIDGVAYEPGGSPARLVDGACEIWFGDSVYARVATLAPSGAIEAVLPIPPSTSPVLGQTFPAPLAGALALLIADVVPAPLAEPVQAWVAAQSIAWADLGARAARLSPTGIEVHAALWDRIAPAGLGRVVLALAEAIAPLATQAVVGQLTSPR